MGKKPITFTDVNGVKVTFNATGSKKRHEVVISMSPPSALLKAADAESVHQLIAAALQEATD